MYASTSLTSESGIKNEENNISVECSTISRFKLRKQQIYNDEVNFQFTKSFEKLFLFAMIALMEDFHWSSISHDAKPTTKTRLNMLTDFMSGHTYMVCLMTSSPEVMRK